MAEYDDPVRYLGDRQNHQRIYEFERDIIRVKNPLNAEFTFIYDGLPIIVSAGTTKDMERYLWRRYLWNMMGHIYNQLTEERYAKAHESFTRTHPDVIDDPYLLNEQIWLKLPRFDNPEFQKKVHDDCYVGIVSKFGAGRVVAQSQNKGRLDPNTPYYQQLINDDKELLSDLESKLPDVQITQETHTMPAATEEITLG